jgi:uncharacterized membrane protein YedE/YeeE
MDYGFVVGTGLVGLGLVVWFVCAYMAYSRAPERHRRPWAWGVLGIFFGPFALFALYLLPKGHVPASHSGHADRARRR